MLQHTSEVHRTAPEPATPPGSREWPQARSILAISALAAVVVGIDTYFSAQDGYLGRGPDYEGIGYLQIARTAYLLLIHLQVKPALHELDSITPLWTCLQTLQFLVVGDGTWQAFTVRFWPVALLLTLVYWIVRGRSTRAMAIVALVATALLPMVSASVRASSWEFLSGQANYFENWGLDDLRPDFLAAVLILWSIAALAEHHRDRRRSAYVVSAAFAAAAVLAKPSTATFGLAAWAMALGLMWLWRRDMQTLRMVGLSVGVMLLLLSPWAIVGGGVKNAVSRLYAAAVLYGTAYSAGGDLQFRVLYYLARLPSQIGQIEIVIVIAGSLFLTYLMVRGRLDRAEVMYAATAAFFYVAFSIPSNKDPNIGEYLSLSVWIFFASGLSRFLATRWPQQLVRASRPMLGAVAVYTLLVYGLGALGLANWPANERGSDVQLRTVTTDLAHELGRHLSPSDCLSYAPGPGWPASLEYLMMDSYGRSPRNPAIDIDPATTTIADYIATARTCKAIIAYREDISQVAQVFFAPAVRQPYLQALSQWVRGADSGYVLDRTWAFTDLPPRDAHPLGSYRGISLTVDLYLRGVPA